MKWTKPTPRRRRRFAALHRVLSKTRINGQVWPDAAGNEAKLTGRALHSTSGIAPPEQVFSLAEKNQ
jgi:hypothetical protein